MSTRRFLHFVFKVADREATVHFFRNVLGMKVLRHEEFEEGCKATCNGPYDGKWSKTMIGYGSEDNHFVAELTYNYGIKSYELGNDFVGLVIKSLDVIPKALEHGFTVSTKNNYSFVKSPDGYKFFIMDATPNKDPVEQVILASSNLQRTKDYWTRLLGMEMYDQAENEIVLGYDKEQCKLAFQKITGPVIHAQAYGRIAFSCPRAELEDIQSKMDSAGETVLTRLVSLDTPGKATVDVIILADPDGHEICFVGDEAFRTLSQVDPNGELLLNQAMQADKSKEWFLEKNTPKVN